MIPDSVERFVELVERSGLVDGSQLAAAVSAWEPSAPSEADDPRLLGKHLVREGLLTAWQCQKLLEGRHRGFMLGNYRLLDHLGSGGMSNVYLAEHVLMQRRVAIKVLPQNRVADSAFLARFVFEGQAVAAMDHPNIVRAYDLGADGRIHYLVMEYIEGRDLEVLVRQNGPLTYHTAAHYVAQAAAGLEHAHQSGLVHRDVKPANLLVDPHQTVKILDMGLAKFRAEVRPVPAFAREDEVLGTAEYLAPEQAVNSLDVDQRADIYGLGCTLYYLLTGRPPFDRRTPLELLAAHRHDRPPSIVSLRAGAPPGLVAICEKMMEKEPARRFQTSRAVFDALAAWLQSERSAGRISEAQAALALHGKRSDDHVTTALRETRANLQDTATIDSQGSAAGMSSDVITLAGERVAGEHAPGSDVFSAPPPPKPPVVSPPRQLPRAEIPIVAPLPPAQSDGDDLESQQLERCTPARRAARGPRSLVWIWTLAAIALVAAALLWAFVATAR